MPRQPRESKKEMIARAMAWPSSGSVPPPSSSMSTRLSAPARCVMPMMFLMWEEKVERFSSMDCASPMSQNTSWNTATSVPSAAGRKMPHAAIRQKRPHIFSVTVLPPVLGPETSSMR